MRDDPEHLLQLEVLEAGDTRVVVASGEVDMSNADELAAALIEAIDGAGRVVVDLSECAYFDSAGMRALVRAYEAAASAAISISLVVQRPLRRVLEIGGLESLFAMYRSRDEALQAA